MSKIISPYYAILLLLCSLIIISLSCQREGIILPPDKMPAKRYFNWTIDTIKYPESYQTAMFALYGTSARNIYAAGFNDVSRGQLWHYNGEKWEPVKLTVFEGGTIQPGFYVESIFGTSEKNIWLIGYREFTIQHTGDSSLIIHYDGKSWTELPVYSGKALMWGWVENANSIWTGGLFGTLLHYNGTTWNKIPFRQDIDIFSIYGSDNGEAYLLGGQGNSIPAASRANFLYQYDASGWNLIDSIKETDISIQRNSVWALNKDNFYIAGNGIYKKTGKTWARIFNSGDSFSKIRGTSPDNLFAIGPFSTAYHYNGTDWHKYEELNNLEIDFTDIWTDGKEVFILGTDALTTYVFHGK